jgi:Na+-translocating ferredoxin:NAD+ oxidoreductase RnfE subunit
MVIGILKGNRGLNLVGTVELWLIGVPGLWFRTSSIDNGSADLELRGLIIAAVIYWAISLLRKYTELKLKSIVFIGIPVTIALAPAIFHTLSTLGGTEIRNLDWWRFSIVLTASLALLVVGSLRELGGTFFPGLIGVIVTVLPYGFHPLSNKEWFLWAILLGVAGLLVWLAVRLENMRKAGREPSAWLKELK